MLVSWKLKDLEVLSGCTDVDSYEIEIKAANDDAWHDRIPKDEIFLDT
jgi:hypothetical protein